MLTPSTLFLLEEDAAGPLAEPPPPAASGEASEKVPSSGPGPVVRVREQQPLSSLSSVLLYRSAPEDLRLLFYDEVCVCMSSERGREGRWRAQVGAMRAGWEMGLGTLGIGGKMALTAERTPSWLTW